MRWDLGVQGVAVLSMMSLGFGVVAWLVFGRLAARWVPVAAAGAFFGVGVLISEVWFGWATEAQLPPNIDGLSFDETLLGVLAGVVVLVVVRVLLKRRSTAGHATGRRAR